MADHVRIAAILRIIHSGLWFVGVALVFIIFGGLAGLAGGLPFAGFFHAIALLLFLCALPSILTAWGMLSFRPWARILAIVLSALSLLKFPFGTCLGCYGLWVLLSKETENLFLYAPWERERHASE